ncbi:MAG TPA: EamA family transporter [Candidatus Rothia avistercoris]|uniref:EamA family transporter n=1 Tax=Candidatus Rothia avistercoris TaxID=2840479 RepID=A0A9D2UEW9_9MICC|nr:EamA family transporter [Candidatus Rothia avistercoris]
MQYPSRKKAPVQAVRSRFTGSDKTTGVLLVIGSCISLQIGAAFAVQLFPQLGAWGVTNLRLGVAALVICALTRPRFWAWNLPQWIAVALLGTSFAFMNGAFYHAIELLPLGLAVSVEFIGPLVLAAVLSRRLIDGLWIGLATIGMALIGVEKAFGAEHISTLGLAFALVAGFFWACYILASSRVGRLIDGAGGLGAALVIATLITLPFGGAGAAQAFADPGILALAVGTGLLSSVVPYTFELAALRRLPNNVFSILLSLEPGIAAIGGWLLLSQDTGALRWTAILLLTVASMGITVTSRPQRAAGEPAPVTSTIAQVDAP